MNSVRRKQGLARVLTPKDEGRLVTKAVSQTALTSDAVREFERLSENAADGSGAALVTFTLESCARLSAIMRGRTDVYDNLQAHLVTDLDTENCWFECQAQISAEEEGK